MVFTYLYPLPLWSHPIPINRDLKKFKFKQPVDAPTQVSIFRLNGFNKKNSISSYVKILPHSGPTGLTLSPGIII